MSPNSGALLLKPFADASLTCPQGTFWYHSHLALQYCDGLRGVIVIKDPSDPFLDLYDVDDGKYRPQDVTIELIVYTESTVIALSDWYHVVAETIVGPAYAQSSIIRPIAILTTSK